MNYENFILNHILNFDRKNDLIQDLSPLFTHKFTDLLPFVQKLLLNSNQHELRITGIEFLEKLEKNHQESNIFIGILENLCQDSKWKVKLACSKVLKIDNVKSTCLLLNLSQDGYQEIEEICKLKLKELKYSKDLLYFIFEQINQRDKNWKFFYLQSLKGLLNLKFISMDKETISMLFTSVLKLELDVNILDFVKHFAKKMNKNDILSYFMKQLNDKEFNLILEVINISQGDIDQDKFYEFLHIHESVEVNENFKKLLKELYHKKIEIKTQLFNFLIKNKIEGYLEDEYIQKNIILYLESIKKYFNINDEWKSHSWIPKSLEWVIIRFKFTSMKLFIPFISKIVQDHDFDNKILGIKILNHFLETLEIEEIKFYDQLLFQFIHDSMSFRELKFINFSLPFLIKLLKLLKNEKFYHVAMEEFLKGFEYSTKEQRKEMLKYFKTFLFDMDIEIVRHFKRIFKILLSEEFLEENSIQETVECLKVIIKTCWIRITSDRIEEIKVGLKDYQEKEEIFELMKIYLSTVTLK